MLKSELFAASTSDAFKGVSIAIFFLFVIVAGATLFALLARRKKGTLWWKKEGRRGEQHSLAGYKGPM